MVKRLIHHWLPFTALSILDKIAAGLIKKKIRFITPQKAIITNFAIFVFMPLFQPRCLSYVFPIRPLYYWRPCAITIS
jgi:hypothetical protein